MTALFVFCFAAGAVGLYYWLSEERTLKRRLRKSPTFTLRELPEDSEGRVIGRAAAWRDELAAPLTGRPCVCYTALVEQHRRSNNTTSYWKTIVRETRVVPFMLEDGTGRAIVDAANAKLLLDFDARSTSGTFNDPTSAERAFLERHGARATGWIFNKKLRYREAIIGLGETIAVLGIGTREPDPSAAPAGYRDAQPTLVRLTSSPRYPLVISDDPSTTVRD